jgi:hypothetical protein
MRVLGAGLAMTPPSQLNFSVSRQRGEPARTPLKSFNLPVVVKIGGALYLYWLKRGGAP